MRPDRAMAGDGTFNPRVAPELNSSLLGGIGLVRGIMPETLFPPLPDEQQQVAKDNKGNDTDKQEVLLQEVYGFGTLLIHVTTYDRCWETMRWRLYAPCVAKFLLC